LSTAVKLHVCHYYAMFGNNEMCVREVSSYDHSNSRVWWAVFS